MKCSAGDHKSSLYANEPRPTTNYYKNIVNCDTVEDRAARFLTFLSKTNDKRKKHPLKKIKTNKEIQV